jgi:hypothetical protein
MCPVRLATGWRDDAASERLRDHEVPQIVQPTDSAALFFGVFCCIRG